MLSRPVSGGRLRPLPLLSKSAPLPPPQQRTIIGPREDSLQSMRDTRALLSYRSGPARGLNEILREKKKERAVSPARRVRQVLAPVVCVKFWQTETGFEPATPRSEVWCSNPLSYTAFLEGLPLKKKWKTKFDNNKLRRYKSFGWKDTGKLTSLLKRVSLNSATRSGLGSRSLHCTHGTAQHTRTLQHTCNDCSRFLKIVITSYSEMNHLLSDKFCLNCFDKSVFRHVHRDRRPRRKQRPRLRRGGQA